MTSKEFRSHVALFHDLIQIEDLSDLDFTKLTVAEDCILAHRPQSSEEVAALQAVLRARYGEREDAPLHRAVQAIVDYATAPSRRRAA